MVVYRLRPKSLLHSSCKAPLMDACHYRGNKSSNKLNNEDATIYSAYTAVYMPIQRHSQWSLLKGVSRVYILFLSASSRPNEHDQRQPLNASLGYGSRSGRHMILRKCSCAAEYNMLVIRMEKQESQIVLPPLKQIL